MSDRKTDRKFVVVTSQHRPDGMATIWAMADREFTPKEATAKTVNLATDMLEKCGDVYAGYNERFIRVTKENKDTVSLFVNPREIEVIVPPKCVPDVVKYMKKEWKGTWKKEEAWEE